MIGKIIGEIFGLAISLFILNGIPVWHVPFITDAYLTWLPVANVAVSLNFLLHLLRIVTPNHLFGHFFRLLSNLVDLVSTVVLLRLFPFNFSFLFANAQLTTQVVKLGLYAVVIAESIAILVEFIGLITSAQETK